MLSVCLFCSVDYDALLLLQPSWCRMEVVTRVLQDNVSVLVWCGHWQSARPWVVVAESSLSLPPRKLEYYCL